MMNVLTQTQILLLDMLHLDAGRVLPKHLQALSAEQWQALIRLATQQHVVPLLYIRLRDKGLETAVPPPIYNHLHFNYRANTLRNRAIVSELHKLTQALHTAHIPVILLKGTFLAQYTYDTIGERVIGDLDLMVPISTMPQVMSLSEQCGFHETRPVQLDTHLKNRHHIPPFVNRSSQLTVEWHWHIVRPEQPYAIPVDPLWQRAIPAAKANPAILSLAPEDLLLHLAYHVSYHHEFSFGIRSLCDLAVISRYYANTFDWNQVMAQVQAWQWQRGVYLALKLAHDYFGAIIPAEVVYALQPDDERERVVKTAVSQLFVDPTAFRHVPFTWRTLQTSKGIRTRLNIIWDALFPSAERMALRYGIAPGSMSPLQQIRFRWRDLARRTLQKMRLLSQTNLAIAPAVRNKNSLSTWMQQNNE